jgi:hypothetical protein
MRIRQVGLFVIVGLFSISCVQPQGDAVTGRVIGMERELGNGTVASYADFDGAGTPTAIGVVLSANALEALPATRSDGHRCFDADGDDAIDMMTECSHWHEFVLPLPSNASTRPDIPFKWALLNWNPYGHIPPGVFDVPHFDFHFYIEPIENVFALQRGACGVEFIRCDQHEKGVRPVPENYMHPDFEDIGAVAPAMGNHLVDLTTPEFQGEPFERYWVYGAYEGRVIFYEEMVARSYLLAQPDRCSDIKMPEAVALTGFYPTRSCVRYVAETDEYTVSMEDFILREASPPSRP